jgi:hypothetical protein
MDHTVIAGAEVAHTGLIEHAAELPTV